jgi:hypothetical protein
MESGECLKVTGTLVPLVPFQRGWLELVEREGGEKNYIQSSHLGFIPQRTVWRKSMLRRV